MNNYILRKSQQEAIDQTIDYFFKSQETHPAFLWNCVMRWGKCLTSLSFVFQYNKLAKEKGKRQITDVLILSFFPSTEDSWSRLLKGGVEEQENFKDFNFITVNSGKRIEGKVNIFFTSFQEIYTGKDKKKIFYKQNYQLLILDEYHYGSWNGKAKSELKQYTELNDDKDFSLKDQFEHDDKLKYEMKLSLSGTPYKASIKDEFSHLYKFTYFDEQSDKLNNKNSDYKDCPQLELYSVSIQKDDVSLNDKIDFLFKNSLIFNNGNLFTKANGASFWLIPSVKDSERIEKYINEKYSNFGFNIINLCKSKGNTLTWLNNELQKYKNKRNIILSFNKLTLGVTIPEIENVVFLREITEAELYMQAGCRAKSQYKDKTKNKAYLISFDLDNDFHIFQKITENDVSEKDFVKLLPINFVKYDPKENIFEVSKIDGKSTFLDALAKIPLHEQIGKTVATRCLGTNFTIPDEILEALNKISGIGVRRNILTNSEKKGIEARKENPLKAIEKEGFTFGCKDNSLDRKINIPNKYPDNPEKQAAFERGYKNGFNYDPSQGAVENGDGNALTKDEEKKRKDSNSAIVEKIKILIQRFLYILIGDYYRENKFIDIKEAPAEFFASLLGFDEKLFIKLYDEFIIDNDYINNMVASFKSKENENTPYLGLSRPDDYDFIDTNELTITKVEEKRNKNIESLVDDLVDLANTDELFDDVPEKETTGQKYIYIAQPSQFLKDLILMLGDFKKFLSMNSAIYEKVEKYLADFVSLSQGVKIGETHRNPQIRCDELNGYTDKHIMFEILDGYYLPVDESKSDIELHKILESKGIKRINSGSRRERFDMTPNEALNELKLYIQRNKDGKYNLENLDQDELFNLFKNKEIDLNEYTKQLSAISGLKNKTQFRFDYAKIPVGSILYSVYDENETCKVVDYKRIEYKNKIMSLSDAANLVKPTNSGIRRGPDCWMYKNEKLTDRRERMEYEGTYGNLSK